MKRSTFYCKQAEPSQIRTKEATGPLTPDLTDKEDSEVFPPPSPFSDEGSPRELKYPMPNVMALIRHFDQFSSPPPTVSLGTAKTKEISGFSIFGFDTGKVEEGSKKWIEQEKDTNFIFADYLSNYWSEELSVTMEKYSCDPAEKRSCLFPKRTGILPTRTLKTTGFLTAANVNDLLNAPVLDLDIGKVKKEFNIWRQRYNVTLNRFGEYILNMSKNGFSSLMLRQNAGKSIGYFTRMHNWLKLDEKLKREVWKMELYKNGEMIVFDDSGDFSWSDDGLLDDEVFPLSVEVPDDLETTSSLDSLTEEDPGQLSSNLLAILNDFDSSRRELLYPKRIGIPRIRTSKATGFLSAARVNALLNTPVLNLDIGKVKEKFSIWRQEHGVSQSIFANYILNLSREALPKMMKSQNNRKSRRHFIRIHNWLEMDEELKREVWRMELFENDDDLTEDEASPVPVPSECALAPLDIWDPHGYTSKGIRFISAANINELLNTPVPNLDPGSVKEKFTVWIEMNGVCRAQFAKHILNLTKEGMKSLMLRRTTITWMTIIHLIRMHNWLEMDEELKRKVWRLELFKDDSMIIRDDVSEVQSAAEIPSSFRFDISELSFDTSISPNNLVVDSPTPSPILSAPHNDIPQKSQFQLLKMFYHDLPELPEFKSLVDATPSKFEWLVTFPIAPNSNFIPEILFKYCFLPDVSFKLDNSISVPHVSFNGTPAVPIVGYIPLHIV